MNVEPNISDIHYSDMRQLALRVALGHSLLSQEAEDVAGEVVLRLWQMRDDLQRFRSVRALVVRMARNESLSQLRRRHVCVELSEAVPFADACPDPESAVIGEEEAAWLERRLKALPPSLSAVIEMRTRQQLSTEEIAATLGLTAGCVRVLLSKARRRLLEEIMRRNDI